MQENKQTISVTTAAKLIMKTPRHVQRLVADGWIKKAEDGRYTVSAVVQGYIRSRDDSDKRGSPKTARADADSVRTKLLQLRLDTESKKLIPLDEALAAVDFVVGSLRSEFIGFPTAFTRDRVERLRLEEAVNAIFTKACGRIKTEADRLRGGIENEQ